MKKRKKSKFFPFFLPFWLFVGTILAFVVKIPKIRVSARIFGKNRKKSRFFRFFPEKIEVFSFFPCFLEVCGDNSGDDIEKSEKTSIFSFFPSFLVVCGDKKSDYITQ